MGRRNNSERGTNAVRPVPRMNFGCPLTVCPIRTPRLDSDGWIPGPTNGTATAGRSTMDLMTGRQPINFWRYRFRQRRGFMKSAARVAFAFSLLICMVAPAFSQSRNTGEIRGTVTAGGPAVTGATVTLTNLDTGETKVFTTNESGIYDTVSTPAGNYSISFTAQGFKKLVRGPIVLQVNVITQDASLDIGTVSETVTVVAEGAPLLETETAHLGSILESKTIG